MTYSPIFWAIAIIFIILAAIFIVWLRHNFRVKNIKLKTGMLETDLERNKTEEQEAKVSDPSVNISGNSMFGRNKISVRREKTNVTKNLMAGENDIEVGAKPGPKAKKKK